MHILNDFEFTFLCSIDYKLLIKGIGRLHPHCPRRAEPITPHILFMLHSYLDLRSPMHLASWSAFLLAFFLMARKSNMVPSSWNKFVLNKHLSRGDIVVGKVGLLVYIKWSKTNQFGSRKLVIPIPRLPDSPLCPVDAFVSLCRLSPAPLHAPAFTFCFHKSKCITHGSFVGILREALTHLGFKADLFSGHSFRRGGATTAFLSRVPGELIQLQGDWVSDAYRQYIDFDLQSKLLVGDRITKYISDQGF